MARLRQVYLWFLSLKDRFFRPSSRGFTTDEILARRFPTLPVHLATDIEKVPPSEDRGMFYYPCAVTLKDGSSRDCVYLAWARQWLQIWGPLPNQPLGEGFIDVRDIVDLRESSKRLPPEFANKLYEAGETGMGYTIFTVCFDDGSKVAFGTGTAIDFVEYPEGKSAADVTDVLPHVGQVGPDLRSTPKYQWAIFERP